MKTIEQLANEVNASMRETYAGYSFQQGLHEFSRRLIAAHNAQREHVAIVKEWPSSQFDNVMAKLTPTVHWAQLPPGTKLYKD